MNILFVSLELQNYVISILAKYVVQNINRDICLNIISECVT